MIQFDFPLSGGSIDALPRLQGLLYMFTCIARGYLLRYVQVHAQVHSFGGSYKCDTRIQSSGSLASLALKRQASGHGKAQCASSVSGFIMSFDLKIIYAYSVI